MDNSQNYNMNAFAAMGTVFSIIVVIGLVATALFIWFYWRIFQKAGFSGALALLNLVPYVGNLICVLILAFGEWPSAQSQIQSRPTYSPPSTTT